MGLRPCSSVVPRDGKVLVLANGAYGQRAAETMYLKRTYTRQGDYLPPRGDEIAAIFAATPLSTCSGHSL